MIINIRGISGSGKSTLARKVMELYPQKLPVKEKGSTRKQPIGYVCTKEGHHGLFFVGHYESACGGADTIHGYDILYPMIFEAAAKGFHVLYEGLLISGDVKNTKTLLDNIKTQLPGTELRNLALAVPLEVCMDSVTGRRKAAWEAKGSKGECPGPMPLARAQAKQSQLESAVRRLGAAGIDCSWAGRDEALELIKTWLRV
jgi:ABC-type dipeptide/oligopeptide/nickel transport system ATPase component